MKIKQSINPPLLIGKLAIADDGSKSYVVLGFYLDPNGCLKTYNHNQESFIDLTQYN